VDERVGGLKKKVTYMVGGGGWGGGGGGGGWRVILVVVEGTEEKKGRGNHKQKGKEVSLVQQLLTRTYACRKERFPNSRRPRGNEKVRGEKKTDATGLF